METKEYILTNSTQLLNRKGATATSLRQLAAYLDMSDGNLRYHFKRKEDLIAAIIMQVLQEIEAATETENFSTIPVLEDVRKQFRSLFFTMYRYRFLFIEANLLLTQHETFRKSFVDLTDVRKYFLSKQLSKYKAKGLFKENLGETYYEMLHELIFMITDNWLRYVELEQTAPSSIDKKIDHYIDLCLQLLDTALNEEGREMLKDF